IVETTRPPETFGTQYANDSGVWKVEAGTVRDMLPPGDGEVGAWWRGGWWAEPRVAGGVPRVACRGWRAARGGWRETGGVPRTFPPWRTDAGPCMSPGRGKPQRG